MPYNTQYPDITFSGINRITLPSGNTYDLTDLKVREALVSGADSIDARIQTLESQVSTIAGLDTVIFRGVSSVELTDGGTETPKVNNVDQTPAVGDLYFYGTAEFVYGSDSKWHKLGNMDILGALAYKDSATASYTPAGTVSQPTFSGSELTSTGTLTPSGTVTVTTNATSNKTATVSPAESGEATYTPAGTVAAPTISVKTAGSTDTIHNPTKVTVAKTVATSAPGATAPNNAVTYVSVSDGCLSLYQLGYTTGDSITTSDVTVKTGDAAYESTAPSFSGTGVRLVTGDIAVPSTYSATFSGAESNVSVKGTPAGTVSQPTFSGTQATITAS